MGRLMNLSFKLTGKDWIGIYLAVLVFYFFPIIGMQIVMRLKPAAMLHPAYSFGTMLFSMLVSLILATPILKKFIGNIYIEDKPFTYEGKISRFFWLNIGNALLSLITLFIYAPWYAARVMRYVVSKTSYKDNPLSFNGKGGHLFVVLLLTFVVPMIFITMIIGFVIRASYGGVGMVAVNIANVTTQIVLLFILIPYFYYVYRWMVNFNYKNYLIKWNTTALPSMGVILREFVLTLITLGIYHPVAMARLYEYFMNRTIITQQNSPAFSFRVKFNYFKVWWYIWGQIILTLITLGIYGAWAYCKSIALFINSTSIITSAMMDSSA